MIVVKFKAMLRFERMLILVFYLLRKSKRFGEMKANISALISPNLYH